MQGSNTHIVVKLRIALPNEIDARPDGDLSR